MKDDPEFNIQFVYLIQENPCLYDHNNADYCNRDVQDMTWERIASQVTETAYDCKERWKNLRACYTRYLKSLVTPGTLGNTKFRKPYYLAEYLSFLKPFTKPRKPKCQNSMSQNSQNMHVPAILPEITYYEENSDEESESVVKKEFVYEDDEPQHHETNTTNKESSFGFTPSPKKFRRENELSASEEVNRSSLDVHVRQNYIESRAENEDADFLFLRSILPDMKEMNKIQKRKFKIGVLNLAGEILNEFEGSPVRSTHPSSSTSLAAMSASHQPEDQR